MKNLILFGALIWGCFTPRPMLGQAIVHWSFNGGTLESDSGYAAVNSLGTSLTMALGSGPGKAVSLKNFAPQGSESGQRGLELHANTAGMDSVWLTGLLRGSSTASRWWHIQASADSGTTWWVAWVPDSGWGPFDVFVPFVAPLAGAAGHESLHLRLVSVFSPVAFSHFGGSFGPHEAYQGIRNQPSSSSQNYSTAGTWRWDNLRLHGLESPPTQWSGSAWSLGAPKAGTNAAITGTYSGPGFSCAVLRVAKGAAVEVAAGGALDVRGRAVVQGDMVLRAGPTGQAQLRVGGGVHGSGRLRAETYRQTAGWQMLGSPLDSGLRSLRGVDSSAVYSWNADSGEYRTPGEGRNLRAQGFFGQGGGVISVAGRLPRGPWTEWTLGYADVPNPSSTVHSTSVTDGWNLLGNPFACGLDFARTERVGVDAAYSVWDPGLNAGLGGYTYYSPSGGSLSPVIPPLQGFWVRAQGPGAALRPAQRGVLGSGGPAPQVTLNLDLPEQAWREQLFLRPGTASSTDFDLDRDAAARPSPTGIRWVVRTPTADAAAKTWDFAEALELESFTDSLRSAVISAEGASGPLWLLGADGSRIRLDLGPAAVVLEGRQTWLLTSSALSNGEAESLVWRCGPGFLWVPGADHLEILNLLGQPLGAVRGDSAGEPWMHQLPEGLYLVRARIGARWHHLKIHLKP